MLQEVCQVEELVKNWCQRICSEGSNDVLMMIMDECIDSIDVDVVMRS